jgi:hypothetical protein
VNYHIKTAAGKYSPHSIRVIGKRYLVVVEVKTQTKNEVIELQMIQKNRNLKKIKINQRKAQRENRRLVQH